MNERRDYSQQWFPATYLGEGAWHGTAGFAQHLKGDFWRFDPWQYDQSIEPFTVHRLAIGLEPVTHPVVAE